MECGWEVQVANDSIIEFDIQVDVQPKRNETAIARDIELSSESGDKGTLNLVRNEAAEDNARYFVFTKNMTVNHNKVKLAYKNIGSGDKKKLLVKWKAVKDNLILTNSCENDFVYGKNGSISISAASVGNDCDVRVAVPRHRKILFSVITGTIKSGCITFKSVCSSGTGESKDSKVCADMFESKRLSAGANITVSADIARIETVDFIGNLELDFAAGEAVDNCGFVSRLENQRQSILEIDEDIPDNYRKTCTRGYYDYQSVNCDLQVIHHVSNWQDCRSKCQGHSECKLFLYNHDHTKCVLKSEKCGAEFTQSDATTVGTKYCTE